MIRNDRIVLSKGIDVDKSKDSKECIICHCYFDNGVKFQGSGYNSCHDLILSSLGIENITNDILKYHQCRRQ